MTLIRWLNILLGTRTASERSACRRPALRLSPLVTLAIAGLALAVSGCRIVSYSSDGGGWSISDELAIQHGVRLADLSDEVKREVFGLIEQALPSSSDLGVQDCETRAASSGPEWVEAMWIPDGSRETQMPPNARDDRIWSVLVGLESTLRGTGSTLARVAFVSREEGVRWNTPVNLGDPIPTPQPDQDGCTYLYQFPTEVANDLFRAITEPAG